MVSCRRAIRRRLRERGRKEGGPKGFVELRFVFEFLRSELGAVKRASEAPAWGGSSVFDCLPST